MVRGCKLYLLVFTLGDAYSLGGMMCGFRVTLVFDRMLTLGDDAILSSSVSSRMRCSMLLGSGVYLCFSFCALFVGVLVYLMILCWSVTLLIFSANYARASIYTSPMFSYGAAEAGGDNIYTSSFAAILACSTNDRNGILNPCGKSQLYPQFLFVVSY